MAHLTLVLQGREVRKFVLNASVTTIGRAQDNDIVINNLALSRRHAQVELKGGRFEVTDLGSQNGVYVNQERIRGSRALLDSDTITLGTYQFVFSESSGSEPNIRDAKRPRAPAGAARERTVALSSDPVMDESRGGSRPRGAEEEHVPLLILTYNDVELQRFPLKSASCVIGRSSECDVQIAERRLSRRHCEIVCMDGIYFVKDLGSQNGTYVNRKRIQDIHELEAGDVLNFAEYAIRYLADGALYDGPDQRRSPSPADGLGRGARPGAEYAAEETAFPDESAPDIKRLKPPIIVGTGQRPPPANPRGRGRQEGTPVRGSVRRAALSSATGDAARAREEAAPPGFAPHPKRTRPRLEKERAVTKEEGGLAVAESLGDVPDEIGDVRPDAELEDWYGARDKASEEGESAVLLRGNSSVSEILSVMMVDKKELDRNLSLKARQRRFFIEVRHGEDRVYSGPLTQPVTILGTDPDADIQIRGRYVAGRHSILVRVKDSLLLVRLGSSSAARVNGLPKLQAFLKTGDVIQIDETTIKIMEE